LNVEHDVEQYVSFEITTQKEKFMSSLEIDGFTLKDEIDSEEFEHGIALVKHHAVTSEAVREVVEELFCAIKKYNAYYEGWSTTLISEETN